MCFLIPPFFDAMKQRIYGCMHIPDGNSLGNADGKLVGDPVGKLVKKFANASDSEPGQRVLLVYVVTVSLHSMMTNWEAVMNSPFPE